MTRYAAFLRAINAGKGHYVKMDALRSAAASVAGLENVQTYIASGNLIFDAPSGSDPAALERALEARLLDRLGFAVPAFLRAEPELREALAAGAAVEAAAAKTAETVQPSREPARVEGALLNVCFTRGAPSAEGVARLLDAKTETERTHIHGRHVFWLRLPHPEGKYLLAASLEKLIGIETTMRNITTPRGMLEKYF